ncbi:MAG TPA: ribonuclease E/G, partial [Micropepsaceae bacterium]|nr:ribonuclease E/G [Micropepsaceae bacterium]
FLVFSEIHPDYYQIPVADRMAILEAQTQRMMAEEDFDAVDTARAPAQDAMPGAEHDDEHAEHSAGEHGEDEATAHEESAAASFEGGARIESHSENHSPIVEDSRSHEDLDEPVPHEEFAPAEFESGGGDDALGENIQDTHRSPESGTTAESQSRDLATVQAEATGAPAAYQRRGPRQGDRPRPPRRRQYKIQEVIKRRQIMLVQVVKEERGNKGASLTTFLSLAGRYCVLMPNTPRGGGISRKITNATDRKRLKSAAQSLELPEGMGLIIRTAGANRTKLEIKRDYEYLLRLWDTVRELTLKSNAPALVYEEGSLIKRAIRDLYSKDISEIIVDGDAGYRDAKDFMRMLMPSHAKNVKPYKEALPLFQSFHVEAQLDAMFSPTVNLKSGGYIVINQTEALVSIDVNSGKATREHSIEETAHKTNLEAADEIGRQLRLRDLAGLIVVDFIDMEDQKNDRNVEKRLHNAVRGDRARIQIGKISQFGLLEMSRQRLRAGVLAGSTITCPHCNGQGIIRSTESAALRLLRALDEEGQRQPAANVTVKAPADVTIYTLNQKRREIARIEEAYDLAISFEPQASMMGGSFELERTGVRIPTPRHKPAAISFEAGYQESEAQELETDVTIVEAPVEAAPPPTESTTERDPGSVDGKGRKRRRRRRGGRGRNAHGSNQEVGADGRPSEFQGTPTPSGEARLEPSSAETDEDEETPFESTAENQDENRESRPASLPAMAGENGGKRRRRRRGRRGRRRDGEMVGGEGASHAQPHSESASFVASVEEHPVMIPNAPSSPLWSLSDQADYRPSLPERAAQAIHEEPNAPSSAAAEIRSRTPIEDTREPERAEEIDATPHEARKGWWQRRFKI